MMIKDYLSKLKMGQNRAYESIGHFAHTLSVHLYTLEVRCDLGEAYYLEKEALNLDRFPMHANNKTEFMFFTRFWPQNRPDRARLKLGITQAGIFMTRLGQHRLNVYQVYELFETGRYSIFDWVNQQDLPLNAIFNGVNLQRIGNDALRILRGLKETGRGYVYSISIVNDG